MHDFGHHSQLVEGEGEGEGWGEGVGGGGGGGEGGLVVGLTDLTNQVLYLLLTAYC